jgi:transcriptional regulator with GAF, ATPase, and Fis domain
MSDVSTHEFFREATVRICGTLAIERGMSLCLNYLQQLMPADQMMLHTYERGLRTMHTIAIATREGGERTQHVTKLPAAVTGTEVPKKLPKARISNRPLEEPINRQMVEYFGLPDSSLLLLFLQTEEEQQLGHLTLVAHGTDRYTEEHLTLFRLLREPFSIALANTLEHDRVVELQEMLSDDNRYLSRELCRAGEPVIGADLGLAEVMSMVRQVASHETPVLLLGETGVGKDVIANALHELSPRRDRPFIKVNCGAIPDTLIDSELFGHEKGAFSGAVSKKRGRFERANTGTIFLDEVGELPLPAQTRLLRVLQNQEIERVGGTQVVALDIRVVAATNRRLEDMVAKGEFREDLWFRLAVFPIRIPPLRERRMDIPQLVHHILDRKRIELRLPQAPELEFGTIDRLMEYDWPGNVRELANLIERALILCGDGPVRLEPAQGAAMAMTGSAPADDPSRTTARLDDVIRDHILRVLEQTDGKIHGPGGAAEVLDVNAGTLRNRMNKLGIEYGRRRNKKK